MLATTHEHLTHHQSVGNMFATTLEHLTHHQSVGNLTLTVQEQGVHCAPLLIFDCCVLTGRGLKLILCGFSSDYTLNM